MTDNQETISSINKQQQNNDSEEGDLNSTTSTTSTIGGDEPPLSSQHSSFVFDGSVCPVCVSIQHSSITSSSVSPLPQIERLLPIGGELAESVRLTQLRRPYPSVINNYGSTVSATFIGPRRSISANSAVAGDTAVTTSIATTIESCCCCYQASQLSSSSIASPLPTTSVCCANFHQTIETFKQQHVVVRELSRERLLPIGPNKQSQQRILSTSYRSHSTSRSVERTSTPITTTVTPLATLTKQQAKHHDCHHHFNKSTSSHNNNNNNKLLIRQHTTIGSISTHSNSPSTTINFPHSILMTSKSEDLDSQDNFRQGTMTSKHYFDSSSKNHKITVMNTTTTTVTTTTFTETSLAIDEGDFSSSNDNNLANQSNSITATGVDSFTNDETFDPTESEQEIASKNSSNHPIRSSLAKPVAVSNSEVVDIKEIILVKENTDANGSIKKLRNNNKKKKSKKIKSNQINKSYHNTKSQYRRQHNDNDQLNSNSPIESNVSNFNNNVAYGGSCDSTMVITENNEMIASNIITTTTATTTNTTSNIQEQPLGSSAEFSSSNYAHRKFHITTTTDSIKDTISGRSNDQASSSSHSDMTTTTYEICVICGLPIEKFDEQELGLCLVSLATFVHRDPSLAAPLLPQILKLTSRYAIRRVFPWQLER